MSHSVIETDSFDPSVVVPDPGDPRNAASVGVPFGQLANRATFLRAHSWGTFTTNFDVPLAGAAVGDGTSPTAWQFIDGMQVQHLITSAFKLYIPLYGLVPGTAITFVNAKLKGNLLGSHSALPATKPTLSLLEANSGSASTNANFTALALAVDASGSVGAYDAAHNLSLGGSFNVQAGRSYYLMITGEAGANAQGDALSILGVNVLIAPP